MIVTRICPNGHKFNATKREAPDGALRPKRFTCPECGRVVRDI